MKIIGKVNGFLLTTQTDKAGIFVGVCTGTALGTVVSITTSGLIAADPALGWQGIFYLHGGLSLIWCLAWAVFVTDTPSSNRFVGEAEKVYITDNQTPAAAAADQEEEEDRQTKPPIPWRAIATSVPFWALLVSHMANNFAWYMLLVELPTFLSVGLGFAISQVR